VTRVEQLTGIQRSPTQVRQFLKKMGLRCRKVGVLLAKVDPPAQEEFKKQLEPRLEEAQGGEREVWFVDASHFVWGRFWAGCGVLRGCG
jgi:hypothetical protein